MSEAVFQCRRCGTCCDGKGGIVLSSKDRERLSSHLGLADEEFQQQYTVRRNHKLGLVTGRHGACVFFKPGQGCAVHPARPDICRAWPFFRGNLVDEYSLDLARDYCPGIARNVSFAEFVRQGKRYLDEHGLGGAGDDETAGALRHDDI